MSASFNLLNNAFQNTTNSYKYYWWMAILRLVKAKGDANISLDDVVFEMLTLVWFPINYYKISLGKSDQLTKYIKEIQVQFDLLDQVDENDLKSLLKNERNHPLIARIVKNVLRYVPYRFVRPWFPELDGLKDQDVNGQIIQAQFSRSGPYQIFNSEIIIDRKWMDFIMNHYSLIVNYSLFELYKYVENNNPSISNISLKLFKPQARKLTASTKAWKDFIMKHGNNHFCVFFNKPLNLINELSIDHFIPWSFVSHDEMWNLHPMEKGLNSSKGNKAPGAEFVEQFVTLQNSFVGFQIQSNRLDNGYRNLFDFNLEPSLSDGTFNRVFKNKIHQNLGLMKKMGFQTYHDSGYDGEALQSPSV
jgi:hypothetical protein